MAERKMVVLRCSDGTDLEVEEAVAMVSTTIRRRIEAGNGIIELADISSAALSKVMEYCCKHASAASSSSDPSAPAPAPATAASILKDWDTVFINSIDDTTLSQIVSASDYLEIKGLQKLSVSKKKVTLCCGVCHDNFVVEGHIALKLKIVRSMLEVQPKCANSPIILPNVTSKMLDPVLEFYRKHSWAEATALDGTKIKEMNQAFVKLYARRSFDLIRAASYLEARSLLKLLVTAIKAVPRLADLTPEDIVTQVVGGHYTKEEENAMVAELSYALA